MVQGSLVLQCDIDPPLQAKGPGLERFSVGLQELSVVFSAELPGFAKPRSTLAHTHTHTYTHMPLFPSHSPSVIAYG